MQIEIRNNNYNQGSPDPFTSGGCRPEKFSNSKGG